MRPYVLSETNYRDVKGLRYEVAVLPIGATEAHNYHLPFGTDWLTVSQVGEMACGRAWEAGAKVACLPVLPFGVNTNTLGFPMAINMNPSTQLAVVRDVVDSLAVHGVRKLVLLNGHGGNELGAILRELHGGSVFMSAINWWQVASDHASEVFEESGDHADEMETSVMLHLHGALVLPLSEAGDGAAKRCRFEAVNRGWVKMARPWHLLTESSGVGDPRAATAEKGERFVGIAVERIGDYLVELAASPMDETFPF